MNDIVIYNEGEIELNISVDKDTIWLTQKQIAELFQVTIPNINMHIKTIYKDKELIENRTIQKYLIVQQEGKRKVKREVDHYNLDEVTIYTKTISRQLNLDLQKYNSQYKPIEIKKFENSHDRFLILDDKEIYHIGASLKDLGKKWFAFSKMDMGSFDILGRLEK